MFGKVFYKEFFGTSITDTANFIQAFVFSIKAIREDSILVSILGTLWALFIYLVITFEPVFKSLGWF